jgi:hypothetical protein
MIENYLNLFEREARSGQSEWRRSGVAATAEEVRR